MSTSAMTLTGGGHVVRLLVFFQAEDGIRDLTVTGVQTCALPISSLFVFLWAGLFDHLGIITVKCSCLSEQFVRSQCRSPDQEQDGAVLQVIAPSYPPIMPTSMFRDMQCLSNGIDAAHETDDANGLGGDRFALRIKFVELMFDLCDRSLEISIRLAILALGCEARFPVSLASSDGNVSGPWSWANIGACYFDLSSEDTAMDLRISRSIEQGYGGKLAVF